MRTTRLLLVLLLGASRLVAELTLGSPFGDHMVLQQGRPLPVWGHADAGATVTVRFARQKKTAVADSEGRWRVTLDPLKASTEPRELTVTATASDRKSEVENRKFVDVLVGEVWLCGGQSNMERQLGPRAGQKDLFNWQAEVAGANYPKIRQLFVKQTRAASPQESVTATWSVCSPETVVDFTAVGYYFARELHARLGVPVGIIHSSWGGTPAEAWTSREALAEFPEFNDAIANIDRLAADPEGASRQYTEKLTRWFAANDEGSGSLAWQSADVDDSTWASTKIPVLWEDTERGEWDGVAWFRRTVDLPEEWLGKELELRVGAVDDIDTTWVNGVEVGSTSGWRTDRIYRIPAAALRAGRNVITVRVLDTGGGGGIWNAKTPPALRLAPNAEESSPTTPAPLDLSGEWRVKYSLALRRDNRPPLDPAQTPYGPIVLYNGMIAPLVPYAIRGATFYQGEANAARAAQYRTLLPAMIADWRQRWGVGEFPFLFVQIAPHKAMGPEIREAQLAVSRSVPNAAMAVTIDVGDAEDIHPANKEPVGVRLAVAARALAYGERIEFSGPTFDTLTVTEAEAVLTFHHTAGGLIAPSGQLEGFTLAGPDGIFHPAEARIDGDKVIVTSSAVSAPVAVRYGWAAVARGNLYNRAGLPASPFRTDAP